MSRGPTPCDCGRAVAGAPFVRGRDCAKCWRLLNVPTESAAAPSRGVCLHLGPQLSAFDRPRCQRLYQCDKGHGTAAGVCPSRDCRSCPDHEPETPPA